MSRSLAWAMMILVLLVGAGLRLSSLNTYPPGVSNDESLDVIDAFHIARTGIYPLYEDLGRPEPLYPLTLALSTALIGPGVWTARLTTAFIGLITLAALYWCATECFYDLSPRTRRLAALLALIVLATAIGHITLSRALYRGIWQPLGMLLCIGWTLRALRRDSRRAAVLSGVFLALTLYSYTAAYVFPAVFVIFGVWVLVFKQRQDLSRSYKMLFIIALVSAVLMLPVGVRFIEARQAVLGRASAVSGGWSAETMLQLLPTLFLGIGDQNPQYNAARAPLIAPELQPLFLFGLLVLLWRIRKPSTPLILGALLVCTLPVLLSQEVPHGLRIAGEYAVFPLVIGAAGAGMSMIFGALVKMTRLTAPPQEMMKRKRTSHAISLHRRILWGVMTILIGLLIWQAGQSWATYRGYWHNADQYRLWEIYGRRLDHNEWFFRTDRRRFAEWVIAQETPLLLPLDEMQQLVTRTYLLRHYDDFATADADFALPPATRLVLPWTLERGGVDLTARQFVLLHNGTLTLLPLLTSESQQALVRGIEGADMIHADMGDMGFGGFVRRVGDWVPAFAPAHSISGGRSFGTDLAVTAWTGPRVLPAAPFTLEGTLTMVPRPLIGHDYWHSIQLLDQNGERVASQPDGPILRWLYPTTQWASGDRVPVPVRFDGPGLPPGAYQLVMGIYPQFGDMLPISWGDASSPDLARLAWLKVPLSPVTMPDTAQPIQEAQGVEVAFDHTFELMGFETRRDDGIVLIDLYWLAETDWPQQDATIFIHALDGEGAIVAQQDTRPLNGQYPTFIWGRDEVVKTTHTLTVPSEMPLRLRIGLYTFPGPQNLLTSTGQAWIEVEADN